ncbi:MAG: methylated-DNA--[protein]-cysteine S-methyltransferase [Candidatus Hodarchaeota archaeon]
MISFFATYFKPDKLDITILISYSYLIKAKKIGLNEIRFFKEEENARNYIKEERLDLINKKASDKHKEIQNLKNLLNEYFIGKNINLIEKITELNINLCLEKKFTSSFSQKVIRNVIKLKRGEIITYSEIGEKIGSKAYRAVGNVLRSNPLPLIIPCHRIIRKDGRVGGFSGVSGESWETDLKKNLLQIEGYTV